jgi:hypothetical protein
MLREMARRARAVLAREPTGDVDVHELATLALDLIAHLDRDPSYRASGLLPIPSPPGNDGERGQLSEMASLERELSRCRGELEAAQRALEELDRPSKS